MTVRIVENPALPADTTSWRLEAEPVVDIGGGAGPGDTPVYDVAGVLRAERQARFDALPGDADRARFECMLAEMPVPDVMPAIDAVVTDNDGSVWVLGVWKDELDVEHVRLYRLLKG